LPALTYIHGTLDRFVYQNHFGKYLLGRMRRR